jgi:glycosyltransferase involved in cell wall biosynthesis
MSIAVSVIIPAYNAAATIRQAVDSAFAQEYRDSEIIVVNDGSTDATREILRGYGDQIRLIEQFNCGRSAACNAAIKLARSK